MGSKNRTIMLSSDDELSSGGEFDPDKTEVPGGGKDLESAIKNNKAKTSTVPTTSSTTNVKQQNKMLMDLITKDPIPNKSDSISASLFNFQKNDNSKNANFGMGTTPPMMVNNNHVFNNFMAAQIPNLSNTNFLPPGVDPKQIFDQLRSVLGMSAKNPHLMPTYVDLLKNAWIDPNQSNMALFWQNYAQLNQLKLPLVDQKAAGMKAAVNSLNAAGPVEEEDDDEQMGVAETYADYKPAKLNLRFYVKHPDPVVETASLSSVEPADVTYKLSLPDETIRSGSLSALQLEAITYAAQKHENFLPDGTRAGFLVGDGAGVGKGRTIAGLIFENYQKGRKRSIWISVSNDLKYDSERDLSDIGASKVQVHALNKLKYAKISSTVNNNIKKGVIFSTYSSLIGESTNVSGRFKSRLNMLIQWFGEDYDGLIVFDECHRAKNLCPVGSSKPTKTGLTVLDLQKKLPKARIVYASATGASEPKNMAYMTRLGMWGSGTPFNEFTDFIAAVDKRGVGAMEIVAMDMKLRGMYIARQLSFQGVSFRIENVPLTREFIKMYDDAVRLWVDLLTKFQEASELIGSKGRMKKTIFSQFWSSHQRFFKYLCIAAKVSTAVAIAHDAVKCGKCVVVGLQSTGEARTLEQLDRDDGELNDFVSTAKGVLQSLIENHFPAPTRNRLSKVYGNIIPKHNSFSKKYSAKNEAVSSSSSNKRKAVRKALSKATKRQRLVSSDSSSGQDTVSVASSDSEYKQSNDDESQSGSESNSSSDYESDASSVFVVSNGSDESDSESEFSDVSPQRKKKKSQPKKKSNDKFLDYLLSIKKESTAPTAATNGGSFMPPMDAVLRACSMKEELLAEVEKLGERLPPNALDQLIDELGGTENVAEMTGRKGRVVQTEDGIQYESRSEFDVPLETLNLTEKQRFMDGEKDVAIISEAASSGISLQSDRRVKNQRRRVHITLELPWSADRAIQQFGRTHRSNQVNAPEYIFLISDLAGEKRFASTVAKRLESLGALTHGDRRATETRDLSQFNIDNKYGRTALEAVMKSIMRYEQPIVKPPGDYKGDFFKDIADALVGVGLITNSETMPGTLSFDKEYNNISKFLNRILGMPVDLQNRLFKYFQDTLNAIITKERRLGRFDLGILDLGMSGEDVKRTKLYKFLRRHSTGIAPTELHIVQVERGMSFKDAKEKECTLISSKEGFYLSHQVRNNKHTAVLAVVSDNTVANNKQSFYIYRPNTGLQVKQETLKELEGKYRKVNSDEAENPWTEQYESSATICSHAYWRGNCRNVALLNSCEIGLRRRTFNILAGSVLSVWARIETVVAQRTFSNNRMQVVRVRIADNSKIVGTLIPKNCVNEVIATLSKDAENTEEINF